MVEHQEDKDQIENLQMQELAKVKHLVLLREQELAEKSNALKEANHQLEKLRNEVARLRHQEEQLSDIQVFIILRCRGVLLFSSIYFDSCPAHIFMNLFCYFISRHWC